MQDPDPAPCRRRVVVVDDDDSMREAIARLVGVAGFRSAAYSSAEAFLAAEAPGDADCIICDLRLPALSGLDLLARLRSGRGWGPVILITAHDAPGLREDAVRRGAVGYLPKPFLGTDLLATIRFAIAPADAA